MFDPDAVQRGDDGADPAEDYAPNPWSKNTEPRAAHYQLRGRDEFFKLRLPPLTTDEHLHFAGTPSILDTWMNGQRREIESTPSFPDFEKALQLRPGDRESLDAYLEVFGLLERIQSGPQAFGEDVFSMALSYATRGGQIATGGTGKKVEVVKLTSLVLRGSPINRIKTTNGDPIQNYWAHEEQVNQIISNSCDAIAKFERCNGENKRGGIIHCLLRNRSRHANMFASERFNEWARKRREIVGIDLAGPESSNPLSDRNERAHIARCFKTALHRTNAKITLHMTETPYVTPEIAMLTLKDIERETGKQVERWSQPIGLCRAAYRDNEPKYLKDAIARGIVFEICGLSYLASNSIDGIEELKILIDTLEKFNARYFITTDNPGLHRAVLAEEYLFYFQHGILSEEQIAKSMVTALKSSFIPKIAEKARATSW